MTIETLLKVVPPPAEPFEPFKGPWKPIEDELGTQLPQDYKDFTRIYGSGYFMQFLGVDIPNTHNPNTRLEWQVRLVCKGFAELNEERPYPFWPDPGGLLPFGGTDNGDYLFWLPRGAPEAWGVVVWDRGGLEGQAFETFDCDLTDFLAGLATGRIHPEAFPEDFWPFDDLFSAHSGPLDSGSQQSAIIKPLRTTWLTRFAWRPWRGGEG